VFVDVDEHRKAVQTFAETVHVKPPTATTQPDWDEAADPDQFLVDPLPTAATTTTTTQPSFPSDDDDTSPDTESSNTGRIDAEDFAALNGTLGVTYSPYNHDGSCKSARDVFSDVQTLSGQYGLIRIYGVDCNQVATVMAAASSTNVKLFLGIFNLDNLQDQISTLLEAVEASIAAGGPGWAMVDTVSVGNELVNNGQASVKQVMEALAAARASLRSAGYGGPVVTVDSFLAVEQNPELCDGSDYCAINVHPFFDANTAADQAGNFVSRKVMDVREVLADPNQRVVVTESGWPWQGNANGLAVPGKANQVTAIRAIVADYGAYNPAGLILFTAFDDAWKTAEAATFYAEQYWGVMDY